MKTLFYNEAIGRQWEDFLKADMPGRDASFFEWKYSRPCSDIKRSLMLLQDDEKVIGCVSSLGGHASICNEKITIRTVVDLYVKKEYRRRGGGNELLINYVSEFNDCVFIAVDPTSKSAPLFEKLQWQAVPSVFKRFHFPIDVTYSINKILNYSVPASLNRLFEMMLSVYLNLRMKCTGNERTYRIYEDMGSFFKDGRVSKLWTNRARKKDFDFITPITIEHFSFYKSLLPGSKNLFIVVYNKGNEPVAAGIVHIGNRKHAEVVEYVGQGDELKYLFLAVTATVQQHQVKVLSVTIGNSNTEKLLRNLLFFKSRSITAYLYSRSEELSKKLVQLRTFSISSGMSDGWD